MLGLNSLFILSNIMFPNQVNFKIIWSILTLVIQSLCIFKNLFFLIETEIISYQSVLPEK